MQGATLAGAKRDSAGEDQRANRLTAMWPKHRPSANAVPLGFIRKETAGVTKKGPHSAKAAAQTACQGTACNKALSPAARTPFKTLLAPTREKKALVLLKSLFAWLHAESVWQLASFAREKREGDAFPPSCQPTWIISARRLQGSQDPKHLASLIQQRAFPNMEAARSHFA